MALGKRRQEQQSAWIATTELPMSPGHPFYKRLNEMLAEAGFDTWLEALRSVLRGQDGTRVDPARRLLPHDSHWLL